MKYCPHCGKPLPINPEEQSEEPKKKGWAFNEKTSDKIGEFLRG